MRLAAFVRAHPTSYLRHKEYLPVATILIAEDEARIAAFLTKGLEKAGYLTHVVNDGSQALSLALAMQFDLILLDVGLPSTDGWAVLKELRGRSKQPPIIVLTALNGLENRQHSLELGANEFVSKPFRFNQLLTCIRHYI